MAKFKCIHTGNIVEFSTEHDIQTIRKHSEYTEVLEDTEEVPSVKPKKTPAKQDPT
jgi:hypothetical protein